MYSKLSIELPHDLAIPFLGTYLEKNMIQKGTCTLRFTAALFTIARTWKQPRCLLADEWIGKLWYIYINIHSGILLSYKKEHI